MLCPLGIPRVVYRLPGEETPQWVDLYNKLYRNRVLFLCSQIEDELANQLCGMMIYCNAENSIPDIYLFMNSLGGYITSGFAIIDVMNYINSDVLTHNLGMCASMASMVLINGEPGRRIAFPHSRAMIHQPIGGISGQALYLKLEANEILRLRRVCTEMYFRLTNVSRAKIEYLMQTRDEYFSSNGQLSFGLVDAVGVGDFSAIMDPYDDVSGRDKGWKPGFTRPLNVMDSSWETPANLSMLMSDTLDSSISISGLTETQSFSPY